MPCLPCRMQSALLRSFSYDLRNIYGARLRHRTVYIQNIGRGRDTCLQHNHRSRPPDIALQHKNPIRRIGIKPCGRICLLRILRDPRREVPYRTRKKRGRVQLRDNRRSGIGKPYFYSTSDKYLPCRSCADCRDPDLRIPRDGSHSNGPSASLYRLPDRVRSHESPDISLHRRISYKAYQGKTSHSF